MKGLKLISESLPKATERVFQRKYIMLGRLLTRWEDVVGKEFYDKTQPVKTRYYKSKKGRRNSPKEVSLDIATSTADATLLHYQKDLILERINQIFGDGFITAIRFVPMASSDNSRTSYKPSKPVKKRSLTHDEKAQLTEVLDSVEDEEIKKRLQNLGTSILQKPS